MKYLDLPSGHRTIVDDDFITEYKWCLIGAGYVSRKDFKTKKTIYLHRKIIGAVIGQEVDHINGDRLDNRRSNLRIANRSQNNRNRLTKGINRGIKLNRTATKKRSWVAEISINNKNQYLGCYPTKKLAQEAYNKAALQASGEFARLVNL